MTIEIPEKNSEIPKETKLDKKNEINALDKPLNEKEINETNTKDMNPKKTLAELDKPLNETKPKNDVPHTPDKKVEKVEKMEPAVVITFKCPEGMNRKEFNRQIKGQERGLNSQTVGENMKNRNDFNQRKMETGNGRNIEIAKKAQEIARQKALQSRIESNQKKGMSYKEAKEEANTWIKDQAALHNPDQIAGGDPNKVSRMGDANINSSIGAQWKNRVDKLADAVNEYAREKTPEELANTKMNVKLVVE